MPMMLGREVLVVDDDEAIRLMLRELLEFSGYRVRTAANGREALEEVERRPPAVVVLDAIMPEMDGPAFLKEQHSRPALPHVPTVVISAYPERAETAMAQMGVEAFLPKPFRLEDLVRVLEHIASTEGNSEPQP
jgi:CheY-like chemotaxis protein